MKTWLPYIVMAVVCGLSISSCTTSGEALEVDDSKVPVHLTLSFSNAGSSRAIDSPTEDGDLDYTTADQSAMDGEDVFVLVFDAESDKLLYQVKDLKLGAVTAGDKYYTRTLEGTLLKTTTNQQVKLVVLANLTQNKIYDGYNTLLETKGAIQNFIEELVGKSSADIYEKLIYNYNGTATSWNITNRRIPMWGVTIETPIPPSSGQEITCKLYRAVAKVNIWVNQKNGYEGFIINSITVNGVNDKGYCVSKIEPNASENIQYEEPSVPGSQEPQSIVYDNLDKLALEAYEDMIFLPEQDNIAGNPVSMTVNYTYNDMKRTGNIEFRDNGIGELFNIVRNHVYVFNIQISEEADAKLYYTVEDFTEHTVNIPDFE